MAKRGTMELSVILPVKNGAGTVVRQLRALTAQETAVRFEVVVVVNGCTDETLAECRSFAECDSRIRVLEADGISGLSEAVNFGVRAAKADFLGKVDHDDLVSLGWVDAMVRSLFQYDVVGGAYAMGQEPLSFSSVGPGDFLKELPVHCGFLPYASGSNCGFRRTMFDKLGGFHSQMNGAEDVDFCWRAQLAGGSMGFAPEARLVKGYRAAGLDRFRQHRGYGKAEVALHRRFRASGHRELPRRTAKQFGWLILHAPDLRHRAARARWLAIAGRVTGIGTAVVLGKKPAS